MTQTARFAPVPLPPTFEIFRPRAYQNRAGNLAKTCENLPIIIGFKGAGGGDAGNAKLAFPRPVRGLSEHSTSLKGLRSSEVQPGTHTLQYRVEKGCFWTTFLETGREDAPDRTNLKMLVTEFSPEPNETLGDPNGAVRSSSLAANF